MTAPIRNMPDYEIYRVITDYEALLDGFLDRIDDLDTTQEQIELLAEFSKGNVQKLLTKNPGKRITRKRDHRTASAKRTFGWESLGKMLKGTGLALVLVVDDGRFAPLRDQLVKRRRQPAIAGSTRPAWLFSKNKAREMAKKRFSVMTESQRKRLARKAGKASARARRRKAKQSGALLAPVTAASCVHGQSTPNARADSSAQA
jgi:hypothetical protein